MQNNWFFQPSSINIDTLHDCQAAEISPWKLKPSGYSYILTAIQEFLKRIKWLIAVFLLLFSMPIQAQYVGGIGFNIGTPSKLDSLNFSKASSQYYELSIKVFTNASRSIDFMAGMGDDHVMFTLMAEVHQPIVYPIDWYLGIGGHLGIWKKNHWPDASQHNNTFAGLDGAVGLQCTLAPIAISVGVRPVYNLYGGEQYYWLKQVGIRICFY